MLITIKNIIGSIRNVLGIVTDELKMWLPFENSEVLGEDVIINGDFSSGNTGWLGDDATLDTSGGKGKVTATSSTEAGIKTVATINLVQGKTYNLKFDVLSATGNFTSGTIKEYSSHTVGTWDGLGSYDITFTYQSSSSQLRWLKSVSSGDILEIDNVSVKEVTQIAPDKSGNSNNATLYTGKALSFDGINDYVDCGNIGISLKTLAFWINLDSTTEKVLQVTSSQSVEVSSGTITLNGTWTGSTIYVDATATSTIAASSYKRVVITTTSDITVDDLELGRIGSSYGDFILSDLEIYNTAWTQADVTYDYNKPNHLVTDNSASTSIALSNLKGYWALSEGAGGLVYDSSGEKNYGTINGATWVPRQATIPQLGLMDWSKGSNMITYSEDFSEWISSSNVTITDNVVISPEGSQNAGLINFTSGGNYFQNNGSPIVSGNTYTISCYVKRALSTNQVFTLYGNNNKTSGSLTATSEWQRLTYTFTADSTNFASGISTSAACQIYLYGFQVEAGSSPSAYRKTNGTGVTDVTLIANPNNPSQDILGNSVRLREHSFNLDGSGYASVADDASINPTSAITIQCWIKSNTENNKGLVAKWNTTAKDYMLTKFSSKFRLYIGDISLDSGTISTSGWVNITGTYDGSNMKTYIDGVLSTTTSYSASIPNNTNVLEIGRFNSQANLSYSERIDDVRIYNRALSSDEILNNYNIGLSTHKAGSSFSDDFSGDYGN